MNRNFNYWNKLFLLSIIPLVTCHHIVGFGFWPLAVGVDGEYAIWKCEMFGIYFLYPIYLLMINYRINEEYQVKIYRIETIPLFIAVALGFTYLLKKITSISFESYHTKESIYTTTVLCVDGIILLIYSIIYIYRKRIAST